MQKQEIHQHVRARYANYARAAESDSILKVSCCAPGADCGCSNDLYDEQMLINIDPDAVNLSLGCGDPVSIASLKTGQVVLDLGSGGGIDCFLAAQKVGVGGRVIGVDMTPEMLEKANKNKQKMGMDHVEFRQGQIEDLPVDDACIDVILSNCVINLSPDKGAVFREAYRVLKPGGRMAISDIVTEGVFSDELRHDMAKWAECVSGAIEASEYMELMQAAGFEQVNLVDKRDPGEILPPREEGMPHIFSARITAIKPL